MNEDKNSELYVVGIGASAGGLDAIQQLFDHTDENTGMAFVIIQHLSPDYVSLMPELLSKHTKMKIFTAEDKQTIEPNCIYLNQRNKNLHIKGRELYLLDKGPKHNLNLPIDIFFHTLGEEYKERSIGVVLSGTGSDGSRGIKTIKEGGGLVLVQDPLTSQFDGMPNSAISTNHVDFILDPESIGNTFSKLPIQSISFSANEPNSKSNETLLSEILKEIYRHSNIDFREYKRNTLLRRLEKRMSINNIDKLYDYLNFLKINTNEKEILKQDFLIGVTRFFRDDAAFQILKDKVIPEICTSKKQTETLRVWSAGCSTGEEVYSLAILIDDYIRSNKLNIEYKLFATDIDSQALAIAGSGTFHINTINEINKEYLEKYFVKAGDKIQIIKRIRERIVFSNHNLINDPPFIKMDLVSCRNMLIYLENKVQKKILQHFHFALNKYGFLFLGNSESLGEFSKYFKDIDTKWKIYQNVTEEKLFPKQASPDGKISTISFKTPKFGGLRSDFRAKVDPELVFHKYLSTKFSPDSIFIDEEFNILFISGEAGKRLTHNSGVFQNNLLKVVSVELSAIIRNGIRKVEKNNKDVLIKDIITYQEDTAYSFDLSIHKIKGDEALRNVYVLQFSADVKTEKEAIILENVPIDEITKQQNELLENELNAARLELQNVIEELETSNEELQSSNEELMASNEELQSTNEELQSVNEELYTVNAEMQEKNNELQNLNNDVNNLLNSTDIGTLFLDSNFRIRKFTPALQKLFHLQESDCGRPIASFASGLKESIREEMLENSKKALKQLITIENEVIDNNGNYFIIKISPFITANKKIDGVVITFVDISQSKQQDKQIIETQLKFKQVFDNSPVGKSITKVSGELEANAKMCEITGYSEKELNSLNWQDITHTDDIQTSLDAINTMKETQAPVHFRKRYLHKDGHIVHTDVYSTVVNDEHNKPLYFLTSVIDISGKIQTEIELKASEERYKLATAASDNGIWDWWVQKNEVFYSDQWKAQLGYKPHELKNEFATWETLLHPEDKDRIIKAVQDFLANPKAYFIEEFRMLHKDGTPRWINNRASAVLDKEGKVLRMFGAHKDINEQKRAEETLLLFQKAIESSAEAISICTLEGKHFYQNNAYNKLYGYTISDFDKKNTKIIFNDQKLANKVFSAIQKGNTWSGDLEMRNKKGKVFPVNLNAGAIKDENGKIIALLGMHRDITEKVEIEKAKEIQHAKTLTLLDAIDDVVYVADPETYELVYTNKKFNEIWGTDGNIIGQKCYKVLQNKNKPCEFCSNHIIFNELPEETYVWEFQNEVNKKWYRCVDKAIDWVDGRKLRMEVASDISAEKQNQLELKKSEERYALATAASDNGIWDWWVQKNEVFYSEQWKAQLGYKPHELENQFSTWEALLHPEDKERMFKAVQDFLAKPKDYFLEEFRMMHKDGTPRWIYNRAAAVLNDKGEVVRMFGAHKDITEQKKAEEELRKFDKMYRGLIENAPDGVVTLSFNGEIKFASNGALNMFGYAKEKLYKKDPGALTHPDDLPKVLKTIEETIRLNKKPTLQYRFKNAKNKWLWIESTFSKSVDQDGNAVVVINFRNIHDRKEYEQELITAKQIAESANAQKNFFMANMSHEIRTPLSGIAGFASILNEDTVSEEEQKRYLQIINSNSKQVLNLINDLMDIAKIEAGEIRIRKTECNLKQIIDELSISFNQLKTKWGKDQITLISKVPEEYEHLTIVTDNFRLRQVLSNLLNNALKFSDKGNISFGFDLKEKVVHFFVEDEGIGIKKADINKIFERFKQVNNSKYGGTGLGLAICKDIIELLGGKITVNSSYQKGTKFTFTIPCKICKNKNQKSIGQNTQGNVLLNKTILIAEDDAALQIYLKRILKSSEAKLLFAKNGQIALEMYKNNPTIDCILMDIKMPVMDGYEALGEILKIDAQAIVIMQTAFINLEEKEKCYNLGCKDYLVKPIEKDMLYKTLKKWL